MLFDRNPVTIGDFVFSIDVTCNGIYGVNFESVLNGFETFKCTSILNEADVVNVKLLKCAIFFLNRNLQMFQT